MFITSVIVATVIIVTMKGTSNISEYSNLLYISAIMIFAVPSLRPSGLYQRFSSPSDCRSSCGCCCI